jgi:predicted small lipoprotein YifL
MMPPEQRSRACVQPQLRSSLASAAQRMVHGFLAGCDCSGPLLLPPQVKSPVVGNLVGSQTSGTCAQATYRPDFNTAGQGFPTDMYMWVAPASRETLHACGL